MLLSCAISVNNNMLAQHWLKVARLVSRSVALHRPSSEIANRANFVPEFGVQMAFWPKDILIYSMAIKSSGHGWNLNVLTADSWLARCLYEMKYNMIYGCHFCCLFTFWLRIIYIVLVSKQHQLFNLIRTIFLGLLVISNSTIFGRLAIG